VKSHERARYHFNHPNATLCFSRPEHGRDRKDQKPKNAFNQPSLPLNLLHKVVHLVIKSMASRTHVVSLTFQQTFR